MPRRGRHRWLALLDGPLAGETFSASVLPPGPRVVRLSRGVPRRFGWMEVHEYRVVGPMELRWVGRVEIRPVPIGVA